MPDYNNYDPISWSLGTPITAGRLQQVSTNIAEVKSASDKHAKGIIVLNQHTDQIETETNGVLHTGLTTATYVIAILNDESGSGGGNQRVTPEASRWYKLSLVLPNIIVASDHENSIWTVDLIKTVSSTDTVLATFKIMRPNDTAAAYAGAGVYSVVFDTVGGSTTPHEFKATVVQTGRSGSSTYAILAGTTNPLQLMVEDVGSSA
jgi:hypothetical protein|tara:strand:+ start:1096 stop:1713 length:618 start_codon:yes stop_codon:yes gene_type:complete